MVWQSQTQGLLLGELERTLAIGAKQLVVHEALDTTFMEGSYFSKFTPHTNMGASGDGADTTTFFAPPVGWQV